MRSVDQGKLRRKFLTVSNPGTGLRRFGMTSGALARLLEALEPFRYSAFDLSSKLHALKSGADR